MQIDIRWHSIELSTARHEEVKQRTRQTLEQFAPYILSVTVLLEDPGGHRRGSGIHCRMAVTMRGTEPITADVLDLNVRAAVDRAVEQAAYAIARAQGKLTTPAVAMPPAVCASASSVFRRVAR
ncbi:MAG: HPF/RaiA family ribosome-associated protein [Candidatus Binatia bacterium]